MDELRKKMRNDARRIWEAALEAANAAGAVKSHLELRDDRAVIGGQAYDLKSYDRVLVVGGGKAGAGAVKAPGGQGYGIWILIFNSGPSGCPGGSVGRSGRCFSQYDYKHTTG